MNRAPLSSKRFVEPTPKGDRAKERRHGARRSSPTPVEPPLKCDSRGRLSIYLGFELIERPFHDPPAYLTKQLAQVAFKVQGVLRRRLVLDKTLDEPSTSSESTRELYDEGLKCRCQQGLGWRRMDHEGLRVRAMMEVIVIPPFHQRRPLQTTPFGPIESHVLIKPRCSKSHPTICNTAITPILTLVHLT